MDQNTKDYPTIDNVLEEFKPIKNPKNPYENFGKVHSPSLGAMKQGAIVALPGLAPCPWCDSPMKEQDQSYIAVCENNPKHIVEWLPWGG